MAVFALVGVGFVLVLLFVASLLRPRVITEKKLSPYECGMVPFGGEWSQFNVRFYIFALMFLIFDVEIVFLFPWAIIVRELGLAIFVEMMIFIVILALGLVYAWKKGVLKWV
ncbi:MAG: NADH-quinone oxidoreductase subunit A [Actinomycetota bacterium]